jgi:hypothetical protein
VLVNKKRRAVAKGVLVTDSHKDMCHGKPVAPNEKKVFILEVIDPKEPPLHPQFDEKITERMWTTWYENQLIFME